MPIADTLECFLIVKRRRRLEKGEIGAAAPTNTERANRGRSVSVFLCCLIVVYHDGDGDGDDEDTTN